MAAFAFFIVRRACALTRKIRKPPKHRELRGFSFHTKTLAISIPKYPTSVLSSRAKNVQESFIWLKFPKIQKNYIIMTLGGWHLSLKTVLKGSRINSRSKHQISFGVSTVQSQSRMFPAARLRPGVKADEPEEK